MKIFHKGKLASSYGKGKKMEGRTKKDNRILIAKYKFDKSIYDNLMPEFNAEFTNYEIVDEYLDTKDIVTTSTETMTIMNYDAEPDEYGVLTTEYEVENVSTFSAENIVTRSIYSDELPTIIRFGNSKDETPKTLCVLEILYLNTNNVTDMYYMFKNCSNLTSIDVSNFDTSNVNNMANMFYGCHLLTQLDVSNFDTSKVTRMDHMFRDCNKLTSLDLNNFITNNVTDISCMFRDCNKLTSLVLGNGFNMDNVTNIAYIFSGCNNLILLIVPNATVSMKLDDHLPTRTADSPGTLIVTGDKYNLDTNTPASKYWNIDDKLR